MSSGEEGKKILGRGLASLLSEASTSLDRGQDIVPLARSIPGSGRVMQVLLCNISFNPDQPRKIIEQQGLRELSASISEHGVLQPIIVRCISPDRYQIVAGERRYHAARQAGLESVPVLVKELDDIETFEVAMVENVQRRDITSIEEGEAYQKMIDEHGHTQESISKKLGKSRSHVANTMRLLKLPVEVQQMVADGSISSGHARSILGCDNPVAWARRIIEQGLSVRSVEQLVRAASASASVSPHPAAAADSSSAARSGAEIGSPPLGYSPVGSRRRDGAGVTAGAAVSPAAVCQDDEDIALTQSLLAEALGMEVSIEPSGVDRVDGNSYRVVIRCLDLEQLDTVVAKLSGGGFELGE